MNTLSLNYGFFVSKYTNKIFFSMMFLGVLVGLLTIPLSKLPSVDTDLDIVPIIVMFIIFSVAFFNIFFWRYSIRKGNYRVAIHEAEKFKSKYREELVEYDLTDFNILITKIKKTEDPKWVFKLYELKKIIEDIYFESIEYEELKDKLDSVEEEIERLNDEWIELKKTFKQDSGTPTS